MYLVAYLGQFLVGLNDVEINNSFVASQYSSILVRRYTT